MPVEKKGSKGSSPKVHQYFKVEGDKATKIRSLDLCSISREFTGTYFSFFI